MTTTAPEPRIAVVGGGPAGLAMALGLVQAGIPVRLITPTPPPPGTAEEARTAALFTPSLKLLERLGVLADVAAASAPMAGIRVVDARGGLLRAPEVLFRAGDAGLDTFGWNVPNGPLARALRDKLEAAGALLTWEKGASVKALRPEANRVLIELAGGRTLEAAVVVAADGRRSICRAGAGIGVATHEYDQTAITANLTHQRAHDGISTEMHGEAGPCTTVPLPGRASSLVWIERRAKAEALLSLQPAEQVAALEARLKGLLGAVNSLSIVGSFPLSFMKAETYARARVMLVSEAAHVMPPIGAQGLNLGLRDVGHCIDAIVDAIAAGRDPGGPEALEAYNRARKGDVALRMTAVDALNRSLLSELGPVHLARGLGLHLLSAVPMLKRAVVAQGLGPRDLPRLMQAGGGAAARA